MQLFTHQSKTKVQKNNVVIQPIPYVPIQIDLDDLYIHNSESVSFVNDETRRKAHDFQSPGRYSKKETGLPYHLLFHDAKHWWIYKGLKDQKALGGQFGTIKFLEQDGKFFIIKLQTRDIELAKKEYQKLKSLSRATDIELKERQTKNKVTQERFEIAREALKQAQQNYQVNKSKQADITDQIDRLYETAVPDQKQLAALKNELTLADRAVEQSKKELFDQKQSFATVGGITIDDQYQPTVLQYQIVMSLAEGVSMQDLLNKEAKNFIDPLNQAKFPIISPQMRLEACIAVLESLETLHQSNWLHRDIKPANVVLDLANQRAEWVDFGLADKMDGGQIIDTRFRGDPKTWPSEILTLAQEQADSKTSSQIVYTEKTDCHSAGILLATFLYLDDFYAEEPSSLSEEMSSTFDEKTNFLKEIVTWDLETSFVAPEERLAEFENANRVMPGPMLREVLGVIRQMTDPNVESRITLHESINQLKIIQQKYENKLNVLLVSLDDFIDNSYQLNKELNQSNIDEVWLTSTKEHDVMLYVKVKRDLEKLGFIVGDKVFIGLNEQSNTEVAQQYLDNRPLKCTCQLPSKSDLQNRI